MRDFDERFTQLTAQKEQLRSIQAQIDALRKQERELERRVLDLQIQAEKEEEDVRRLEGRSLMRLYYTMTGGIGEKMRTEQVQAQEARVRCDAAERALDAVRGELDRLGSLAYSLRDCEAKAEALMQEKAEALRRAGTPQGERLIQQERRIGELDNAVRELHEAVNAGRSALRAADAVIECFDDAKGFGVWDMLGGDLIADLAKHRALDRAQEGIERLEIELRRFSTELADIEIGDDFQANIDGFLHFADYFFDGLFVDLMVMNRIEQGKRRAQETGRHIEQMLTCIDDMYRKAQNERKEAERKLEQMILDARL